MVPFRPLCPHEKAPSLRGVWQSTVNLRPSRQRSAGTAIKPVHISLRGSTHDLAPRSKGAIPRSPILTGGKTMTAELEVVVDRSVDGEKLLRMPG